MKMDMNQDNEKQKMNIVFTGHVDHGKSTVIGRLLADTNALPEGKLEQIQEVCRRNSKPFEYAFLIDTLKDEQSQGLTIDSARVFFSTRKRHYVIIDAPGHIEFLKNMITGASRAEASILVIAANEGVQENSRRHGYMLSMLGIKQIAVLVNKMDLVGYNREVYQRIVDEYTNFLKEIKLTASCYIPVSGVKGDNIAHLSKATKWYTGQTMIEVLDEFVKEEERESKPFRMPVQDVYKFTNYGDSRRIIAGTIETGSISIGDEVIFFPSGKKSVVKTIESFNSECPKTLKAGYVAGFTLTEQIYVTRGEIAVKSNEQSPKVSSKIRVSLFWLGRNPMEIGKEYILKHGSAKIPVKVEEIERIIDASNIGAKKNKKHIGRHDVAECVLSLKKPLAFDVLENNDKTSRFVIVDDYEIRGGGIIKEAVHDKQADIRDKVFLRNYKWEKSFISSALRSERYNQKAALIIITGQKDVGKKLIAKKIEEALFHEGKFVYFLGIGNILYGVDADIKGKNNNRVEHMRRLAEVAHIMLDAGIILIVTAVALTQDDKEIIKTVVNPERIETVWIGEQVTTDISYDYHYSESVQPEEIVNMLKERLQDRGFIFRSW